MNGISTMSYQLSQREIDETIILSGLCGTLYAKYMNKVEIGNMYRDKIMYADSHNMPYTALVLRNKLDEFTKNETLPARERWLAETDRYIHAEQRLRDSYYHSTRFWEHADRNYQAAIDATINH